MLNKEIHTTALGVTPGNVHFSLGLRCDQLLEDTLAQIEASKMVLDTVGLTSGERRCEDVEESPRRGKKQKWMRKTLAEMASDMEFMGKKSVGKSRPKGALWASPGLELMFERLLGAIVAGSEEVRKAIEANMEAVAESNYEVGLLHGAVGAVAESVLNQNRLMQGFRGDVAGDVTRNVMQAMTREMESHMEERRREEAGKVAKGPSGVQGSASNGDDEAEEGDVGNIGNVGVPEA